ncbi:DUF2993 domain-containing protein [Streptomyces sp. NPDC086787]|uniref:LmeA family phospholipid-binding protein n=1 Tax=Streptomyces sp. NPDC086787 TaxID=3365759 RepID=UPI003828BB5D
MIGAGLLRRRFAVRTSVVLAVLLLVGTAAEAGANALLNHRVSTAVGRVLGKDSEVSVDGGPALLLLFQRHFDAITVSSDDADLGRFSGVGVKARLDDVRLTGDESGTVDHTSATVRVPTSSFEGLADTSGGQLPVTGVQLDDKANTVTFALGQGGLAQATLRPTLRDGRVAMDLEGVKIFGNPAPATVVDRLRDRLSAKGGTDYPLGLRATAVDVTDSALEVTLAGGKSRFTPPKE